MDITLADQYFVKALDYYPYDLENTFENLTYALSYDEAHAPALCLLAKVYMYQLKDYHMAGEYFYKSLQANMNYPETYKHYSMLRIWQSEYLRAQKIIARGMRVRGIDMGVLKLNMAIIYELQGELNLAKRTLNEVKQFSTSELRISNIDKSLKRLKKKRKSLKKK